jgi:hypothetical protein
MGNVVRIAARRDDIGSTVIAAGREAWALAALIDARERGCTPIEQPAPRWLHYVFLMRRRGLDIETIEESQGGPFKGSHGRYVLRTQMTVLAIVRAGSIAMPRDPSKNTSAELHSALTVLSPHAPVSQPVRAGKGARQVICPRQRVNRVRELASLI